MTDEELARLKARAVRLRDEGLCDGLSFASDVVAVIAEVERLRVRVTELEEPDIECMGFLSCEASSSDPDDHSPHCPMFSVER